MKFVALCFESSRSLGLGLAFLAALNLQACAHLALPKARVTPPISKDDYPDAGAVVTDADVTLEYRVMQVRNSGSKRLVAVLDERKRLKILRASGLAHAKVALAVDGLTTVTQVIARAISPAGEVTWMRSGAPHFVPSVDGAPEMGTLEFEIPGAEVGADVEYRYERVYLNSDLVPPYVFGGALPTLHAELGIVVDPLIKLDLRFGRGDLGVERAALRRKTVDGRDRLVFVENDLPAYFPEPEMAHPAHAAPWIGFALRRTQLGPEPIRVESWDDVGRRLISVLRACHPTAGQGATRARLEVARSSLVPLAGLGLGLRMPQPAKALWHGAPACSRDAAAVTLGLLQGAPTHARLALLTGPYAAPVAPDFPTPAAFARAVVALPIEAPWLKDLKCSGPVYARDALCGRSAGELMFFDPLCSTCPLGVLPPGYDNARVLLVEGDGDAAWTDFPQEPPAKHSLVLSARLSLDVDGSVAGTLTGTARGFVVAEVREQLHARAVEGDRFDFLEATLLGPKHAVRLRKPTLQNFEERDQPLGIDAILTGQLRKEKAEHFEVSAEALLGSSIPDAWRPSRRQAALVGGPRWTEATAELLLPVDYVALVHPPTRIVTPFAEYAAGFVQEGRSLRYTRRFVLKVGAVAADDWPAFEEFFAAVQAAEAAPFAVSLKG